MSETPAWLTEPLGDEWPPEGVAGATARVLAHLAHLRFDESSDRLLIGLVDALCSGDMDRLTLVAFGDEERGIRPWQVLTDPRVAPLWAMPFAVQFVGGRMPARLEGESDDDYLARARAEVLGPLGMLRGSTEAYALALKPYLRDTRYVRVICPYGGDPRAVLVIVLAAEVRDRDGLLARANAPDLIGAGMRATVAIVDAPVIDEITDIVIDDALLTFEDARDRENWEAL